MRAAPSAPVIAGLLVDAVFEVVTVSEADVDPPIATLDRATAGVIRGEVMLTGRLTALIDVAGLFAALLPPESGAGRGA
ncbi:MAG: chemotaxis protein CheW [Chloroflexi bacterium]|nr:chemotaxis protein CheW [Chloroflexota bacterium]